MGTIQDLYDAVAQLRIKEQLPVIIKRNEYPLMLKVIGQRDRGYNGEAQKILPPYKSKYYMAYKMSLNPLAGGSPDGKVTGNYNSELHLTIRGDDYEIESDVDYAKLPQLTQYGNSFNLPSEQSRQEYWDETLTPEILNYISEVTGL